MRPPAPQPRRRDAAVIVAMMLVAATLWLTVLGPLGGHAGWYTLGAVLVLLALAKLGDPLVRRFSRWVRGRSKRAGDRRP